MATKLRYITAIVISLIFLTFTFQNCGPTFDSGGQSSLPSVGGPDERVSPGDSINDPVLKKIYPNLVDDCEQFIQSSNEYNACIFWKNPVAQSGQSLSPSLHYGSDLSNLQVNAVRIEGHEPDSLSNSSIKVAAAGESGLQTQSVTPNSGDDYVFSYQSDPNFAVGQLMAYYWLTSQIEFMEEKTGAFYAKDQGIFVNTLMPGLVNAYWSPSLSEPKIVLGATDEGNQLALNADVYLHEMGHANLSYATAWKIHQTQYGYDRSCGRSVCCVDANGCSWAINEGQADYHSAIIFESNPALGETFVNRTGGLSACGISRNVEEVSDITARQVYEACSNYDMPGEVHAVGILYASIWWEVRKKAKEVFGDAGKSQIDALFTEHLPLLNGRDNFKTAFQKIVTADRTLFQGTFTSFFREEYRRRGIVL